MTDIEQQIKDILSRSCPANDNRLVAPDSVANYPSALTHGVSVIGNNNVVISSNVLTLALFLLFYIYGLLVSIH